MDFGEELTVLNEGDAEHEELLIDYVRGWPQEVTHEVRGAAGFLLSDGRPLFLALV